MLALLHFGCGNSVLAEARALHDGLSIVKQGGLSLAVVFSDCALLVEAIWNGVAPSWTVLPWWRRILDVLQESNFLVQHTYREGNQVADSLASYACSTQDNAVFTQVRDLPQLAKGAFRTDKAGLPAIRIA